MRWRWHCRNFRGQKDVFPAEVSEAPSPQRSTGSRAEAEFGKYRVKPRRLRGHETGMRIEERAVKDQQVFSHWATFFSYDWQCERWATPSFLDYLSVSGSVLLLDLSKCELLKTQYHGKHDSTMVTQLWSSTFSRGSGSHWNGTQPELILLEWHLCWHLIALWHSVHVWIKQTTYSGN